MHQDNYAYQKYLGQSNIFIGCFFPNKRRDKTTQEASFPRLPCGSYHHKIYEVDKHCQKKYNYTWITVETGANSKLLLGSLYHLK